MSKRDDSNDECRTETTTTMENNQQSLESQESQESQVSMAKIVDVLIANKKTIAISTGVTAAVLAPLTVMTLFHLAGFGPDGVVAATQAAKWTACYKGLIISGSWYSIAQSIGAVGLPSAAASLSSTLGGLAGWVAAQKLLQEHDADKSESRVETKVKTTDPSSEPPVATNKDAAATDSLATAWRTIRMVSLSAADTGLTYTREGLARVAEWSSEKASNEDKTETTTQSSSEPVISNGDASPAGAVVAALYSIGAISPSAADKGLVSTIDTIVGLANTWHLIQKHGGLKVEIKVGPLDPPSDSSQSKP